MTFRLTTGEEIPLEFHKARVVQKVNLLSAGERLESIRQAGFNTFLLKNRTVFLDMLTDSGVNAISDRQLAAMFEADDAYAGSESFFRFEKKIGEIFGKKLVLPVHQGRAAENVLARSFISEGQVVPMNYHFTTTKAHIDLNGGRIEELVVDEGLKIDSDCPFKGNLDIGKLENLIADVGPENIAYVRMEACTNLIGGQPFSMENLYDIRKVVDRYGLIFVLDASLLAENLHFIKKREAAQAHKSIHELTQEICGLFDIVYFSARKISCSKGGAIITNDAALFDRMKEFIPLFEGFLTYGGMSVREIESITVGLEETMDEENICQSPDSIEYMVAELKKRGIPVVTPGGALGCHLDAGRFMPGIRQEEYPAGALAAALYLVSGIRGMERGTLSSVRLPDGKDLLSDMELLRLALPRRVFTMSHIKFAVDRIVWLYENRTLVGGLTFVDEPKILRFFMGRLAPIDGWDAKLIKKFKDDFGESK